MKPRRALISVSDKRGIVELAQGLAELGVEILSTGGTERVLREAGVAVTPVSTYTGFPEILGGRVKTLHPRIFGGILTRRSHPTDPEEASRHDIDPIDLVVVNLYPFRETVARGAPFDEVIEEIDIGGPSLLRAAAKNHPDVLVVVRPERYEEILDLLRAGEEVPLALRRTLAREVFAHTAAYDAAIARYFSQDEPFPETLVLSYQRIASLRYGENPQQAAAFYGEEQPADGTLATARILHGKELSYNNLTDTEAVLGLLREFAEPVAVAVKHQNPCGVAVGEGPLQAFQRARDADPVSIFGGIVGFNRPVDGETAAELARIFLEVIVAPGYTAEALEILQRKKDLRLLEVPILPYHQNALRSVSGGVLVQSADETQAGPWEWQQVTGQPLPQAALKDLWFAWRVVKHVKSNAIVLAKDGATTGIGAGQTNRIDAARIAADRAGERAQGSVLASDAFFPFGDVVTEMAARGVAAFAQPGGSIRDAQSIEAARDAGTPLYFTGRRHFRH